MRRNPIDDSFDDRFDDRDELPREVPERIRRVSTTPVADRNTRRGEVRYIRPTQRLAPRRGPDPRVWFIRGSIGVAALAGLWLGLQALFPMNESRVSEAPTATLATDSGAATPAADPAAAASALTEAAPQPATAAQSQPAPAEAAAPVAEAQPTATLAAPEPTAIPQPAAQAAPPPPVPAQPTPEPDRLPGLQPRPADAAAPQPTPIPAPPAPQPAAQAQPPADPNARPTAAPIPPPENPQSIIASAPAAAPAPTARPAAPPPPPARTSGGPFEVAASTTPANPISEQAQVTVTVKATQNGAPMAGAFCMATVYYRTATAKQPNGGFSTNGNGVGSFVLDARGTTYGFFIPIDVTCSARGGSVTTRTGFTPVKGR